MVPKIKGGVAKAPSAHPLRGHCQINNHERISLVVKTFILNPQCYNFLKTNKYSAYPVKEGNNYC